MHARLAATLDPLIRSSPLRHERFRRFYIGSVGTALGYTMQATVAAWLMATLTPSELMVALVQTASTLPSLAFGLVAGTLADIVDRRKVVLSTQILLLSASVVLGVATLAGIIGPIALLVLTFVIGLGFTFYIPAQQALVNDLVGRADLSRAVALAAVGFNVSRAIGPAVAGAIAAWLGSGSAMLASAAFFVWMIFAVRSMPVHEPALLGVPETLLSGVQSGLRYLRHSPPLRSLVIRNLTFTICASSLWALLPVIARDQLGLGAGGFGMLLAFFGAGAIFGALWIPRHLQKYSLNAVVTGALLTWAVAGLIIALAPYLIIAIAGTCMAGAAWVSVHTSLSAGTQSSVPGWVRARAVSLNFVAMQASLAVGSVIWGAIASAAGTRISLSIAASLMVVLFVLSRHVRIALGKEGDVTGVPAPQMSIIDEPSPDDGPVLIQLEYRIDGADRESFLRAIRAIETIRRRNGASSWRVFRDLEDEGRFVERFVVSSWAEYTRQRSRMTVTDRELQDRVTQLHRSHIPIRISRLIGVGPADIVSVRDKLPPH